MEIVDHVKALMEKYLHDNCIELVEAIYRREQGGMVLRVLVDTRDGISIKECELLNKYLGDTLERENVINEHFTLEVSSPGLDRPIVTDRDFNRSVGKVIELTTFAPVEGRKTHEGKLLGMDKENVVIEKDGVSVVIPRKLIAVARLKIEF